MRCSAIAVLNSYRRRRVACRRYGICPECVEKPKVQFEGRGMWRCAPSLQSKNGSALVYFTTVDVKDDKQNNALLNVSWLQDERWQSSIGIKYSRPVFLRSSYICTCDRLSQTPKESSSERACPEKGDDETFDKKEIRNMRVSRVMSTLLPRRSDSRCR
jgi:hypothetical protein